MEVSVVGNTLCSACKKSISVVTVPQCSHNTAICTDSSGIFSPNLRLKRHSGLHRFCSDCTGQGCAVCDPLTFQVLFESERLAQLLYPAEVDSFDKFSLVIEEARRRAGERWVTPIAPAKHSFARKSLIRATPATAAAVGVYYRAPQTYLFSTNIAAAEWTHLERYAQGHASTIADKYLRFENDNTVLFFAWGAAGFGDGELVTKFVGNVAYRVADLGDKAARLFAGSPHRPENDQYNRPGEIRMRGTAGFGLTNAPGKAFQGPRLWVPRKGLTYMDIDVAYRELLQPYVLSVWEGASRCFGSIPVVKQLMDMLARRAPGACIAPGVGFPALFVTNGTAVPFHLDARDKVAILFWTQVANSMLPGGDFTIVSFGARFGLQPQVCGGKQGPAMWLEAGRLVHGTLPMDGDAPMGLRYGNSLTINEGLWTAIMKHPLPWRFRSSLRPTPRELAFTLEDLEARKHWTKRRGGRPRKPGQTRGRQGAAGRRRKAAAPKQHKSGAVLHT